MTSRADRERHVAQMLASSRLEGLEPDEVHQQLLQDYIEGTASLDDLLSHARDQAASVEAAYRSRPGEGGTYYLMPRDRHLLSEMRVTAEDDRMVTSAVEAEQQATSGIKNLMTLKWPPWSMLSFANVACSASRIANWRP